MKNMMKSNQSHTNPLDVVEKCRERLKVLSGHSDLFFTKRCNKAIELSLDFCVEKLDLRKKKYLLIQEEGGWITYKKYAVKHNLEVVFLKMKDGKILSDDLRNTIEISDGNCIIIVHSMPGYSYLEDMTKLYDIIQEENLKRQSNMKLVNDCCGSIGTGAAKIGDIVVCSFGESKPLSIGTTGASGGFISFNGAKLFGEDSLYNENNDSYLMKLEEHERVVLDSETINPEALNNAINALAERLDFWHRAAEKIKRELSKKFEILNPENQGINVLIGFSGEEEKEKLINYCREQRIEYTECPRYIRTNKVALSLEIKRQKFKR